MSPKVKAACEIIGISLAFGVVGAGSAYMMPGMPGQGKDVPQGEELAMMMGVMGILFFTLSLVCTVAGAVLTALLRRRADLNPWVTASLAGLVVSLLLLPFTGFGIVLTIAFLPAFLGSKVVLDRRYVTARPSTLIRV